MSSVSALRLGTTCPHSRKPSPSNIKINLYLPAFLCMLSTDSFTPTRVTRHAPCVPRAVHPHRERARERTVRSQSEGTHARSVWRGIRWPLARHRAVAPSLAIIALHRARACVGLGRTHTSMSAIRRTLPSDDRPRLDAAALTGNEHCREHSCILCDTRVGPI